MLVKEESMDANDILRKYAAKIESQISTERNVSFSKEYAEFKEEFPEQEGDQILREIRKLRIQGIKSTQLRGRL